MKRIRKMAAEPSGDAGRVAGKARDGGRDLQVSPKMLTQRARLEDSFGGTLQKAGAGRRDGLPGGLRSGIERLSGVAMDHVEVHYHSSKPARLNAHAYAQGSEIHLGPGQERHLPHEAWHVVQQAQGRVRPTIQAHGVAVNDDAGLEREADVMGARAARMLEPDAAAPVRAVAAGRAAPVQRIIRVGGNQIEPEVVYLTAAQSTSQVQHPQLARWLRDGWARDTTDHDYANWNELWEAALLAYLAEKEIIPGESASGAPQNFPSATKRFGRVPGNKLVARSREPRFSWQLLREMDAYDTIRRNLGGDVRLPSPELVRLPGEGDAPGPLALRMDFLEGGAFIDLFKGTPKRILGQIAQVILRDGDAAEDRVAERNAVKALHDSLVRLREAQQARRLAISDLQGHVAADGTFTLVDPLWAGPDNLISNREKGAFAQLQATIASILTVLKAEMKSPGTALRGYAAYAEGPNAD